jgi:hypothetical protein
MMNPARSEWGGMILSLAATLYRRPVPGRVGSTVTSPIGKRLVEMMLEGSLKNRKQGIQKLKQRMRQLLMFKIGRTWQPAPPPCALN